MFISAIIRDISVSHTFCKPKKKNKGEEEINIALIKDQDNEHAQSKIQKCILPVNSNVWWLW